MGPVVGVSEEVPGGSTGGVAPAPGAGPPPIPPITPLPAVSPVPDERVLWRSAARLAARVVGMAVLLGILVLALLDTGTGPLPEGSPAPPVVNARNLDGRLGAIAFAHGKPTVVNIWATWCPPCLQEMPAFARVSQKHRGQVRFVGLAADSAVEDVRAVVERLAIPYDIARIDSATVRAWNATSLPSTYVIDGHGHVVWSKRGAIDEELLDRQLAPVVAASRESR